MKEADDPIVWQYAVERDMVVVSKDEDFSYLASVPSGSGKLVWVRIGNCRKHALIDAFTMRLAQIVASLEAGSRVVEIR